MKYTWTTVLALVTLASSVVASPAHSDDARLIQFRDASGTIQTEWVPAVALNYLAKSHDNVDRTADELDGMSLAAIDAISSVRRGPGFLDITESKGTQTPSAYVPPPSAERVYPPPDPSKYPFLQSRFFKQVNATGLYNTVNVLSNNYTTRAYQSPNARAPALWVRDQFRGVVGSGYVRLVENPTFNQPNGEPIACLTYTRPSSLTNSWDSYRADSWYE